jgi:zinc transport system substrate-binding protein
VNQVAQMTRGTIWFQIGEPFEKKIEPFLKEKHRDLIVVDLRDNIPLIAEESHACAHCSKEHLDRHVWLNPKLAIIQAETITETLSSSFPEHATEFWENYAQLKKDLIDLDTQLSVLLAPFRGQSILVSHPAFGYFCKEYGLTQISIEHEGKDPRPQYIEHVMKEAKEKPPIIAILLPQYNNKGTLIIAKELHIKTVNIDPYAENYIENLTFLAQTIAQ